MATSVPAETASEETPSPAEVETPSVETPAEEVAGADEASSGPVDDGGEPPSPATPPTLNLEDPDVQFVLGKFGNDPNALARDWHGLNSRAGEWKRDSEELAKLKAERAEATSREPQEQAPPAPEALQREVEARVWKEVSQDPECRSWRSQSERITKRIDTIVQTDELGNAIGGELVVLDRTIMTLEGLVDGGVSKALGIEMPLGEFELKEATARLKELKRDRYDMVRDLDDLFASRKRVASAFDKKFDSLVDRYKGEHETSTRQRQEKAEVDRYASEFSTEWQQARDAAFKSQNIPNDPKFRASLESRAKLELLRTRLIPGKENPTEDLAETTRFLEDYIKAEREHAGVWTAPAMKAYIAAKKGDTKQAAPKGKAAVAPPDPANSERWEERWEARAQEALKQIRGPKSA